MTRKFLIILFATIFYNGVTYSSPVNEQQTSDFKLPEEKPPTVLSVATEQISKKIEPTPAPTIDSVSKAPTDSVSPKQNETQPLERTTVKIASVQPEIPAKSSTLNPPPISSTNKTQAFSTTVVPEVTENKSVTQGSKNMSQIVENKKETPAPTEVSAQNASSATTSAGPTTTTTTITTTTSTTTTTAKTPSAEPSVTTLSPAAPRIDSAVTELNTPAHEKHFDGPSFIGGIVLTIGLTAIGFIAFKYYKSGKIDINYRTL